MIANKMPDRFAWHSSNSRFLDRILIQFLSTHYVAFPMCIAANCSWSFVYCVIILCVSLLPRVYCFTMCVLLSYILQLPDCWLEVSIRKVLRPTTSHRFFLVSLCLKANAEMVLKTPSCYCMLLMQPSRLKSLTSLLHTYVLYMHNNHCHRVTAHLQSNIYCIL